MDPSYKQSNQGAGESQRTDQDNDVQEFRENTIEHMIGEGWEYLTEDSTDALSHPPRTEEDLITQWTESYVRPRKRTMGISESDVEVCAIAVEKPKNKDSTNFDGLGRRKYLVFARVKR